MKRILLLLTLSFFAKNNYAQDIILTFDGVIGNPSVNAPLDRVIIENKTNGETKEITGSYVFNLTTNTVLDIEKFDQGITQKGFQNVYPNPFSFYLNIEFYSEGVGITTINFYNLLGQKTASFSREVERGTHRLKFSPNKKGLYLVSLNDNGNTYHSKVISSQNNSSASTLSGSVEKASILYTPSTITSKNSYSNKAANSLFGPGDEFVYTGYYGNQISKVYDTTTESKTITFDFSEQAELIIGTWIQDETTECGGLSLNFSSDLKASYTYTNSTCSNNIEDYIIEGNTLYLTYDNSTHSAEITELTATKLVLKEVDGSEIYISNFTRQ